MQFAIVAVDSEELVVCAALYDLSVVQYIYLVGILDSRQTVCDSHCCACLHKSFQGVLHQSFAFRVESLCGFVEYKDRWILQYGACYAHPLTLTARQTTATVAD